MPNSGVPNPLSNPELFCNTVEAASILGITRGGVIQAYGRRKFNKYTIGRSVLWLISEIEQYRDSRGTFPVYLPGSQLTQNNKEAHRAI